MKKIIANKIKEKSSPRRSKRLLLKSSIEKGAAVQSGTQRSSSPTGGTGPTGPGSSPTGGTGPTVVHIEAANPHSVHSEGAVLQVVNSEGSVLQVVHSEGAVDPDPKDQQTNGDLLKNVLEEKNKHIRDENIEFFEESHKYIVNKKENDLYTSVTTFIHSHFSKFDSDKIIFNMMRGKNWNKNNKYWGMTPFDIKKSWDTNGKEQAGLGTKLHYDIECFMNIDIKENDIQIDYKHKDILQIYEFENSGSQKPVDLKEARGSAVDSVKQARPLPSGAACLKEVHGVEWEYFLNFVRDHPEFQPYRTEMRVYDDQIKIAGSIDMIYKNNDGTFSIYDWKRSKGIETKNIYKKFSTTKCIKHLPDLNFYHYSLQLNLYKYILEKNYDFKIKDLFLVQLHPNFENYNLIQCLNLDKEIQDLIHPTPN